MSELAVTPGRAEQHETLVLRLEALLNELRPLAARHATAPVPAALQSLAEGMLFDVRPFAPRRKDPPLSVHRRRQALPVAAPDYAGLVVQLGQALAALDAFEVRHSVWSVEHAAFVWRLARAGHAPVARLRPRLAQGANADRAAADRMRSEVVRLIEARVAEAYEKGFEEGTRGTPPPG